MIIYVKVDKSVGFLKCDYVRAEVLVSRVYVVHIFIYLTHLFRCQSFTVISTPQISNIHEIRTFETHLF